MAKRRKSPPSYRRHKQSGQAVVTLSCAVTGKRRDVLLGEYDSAESWSEYARVIAEWEKAGRVLDGATEKPSKPTTGVTVAEVMLDWWEGQLQRYGVKDPEGRLPSRLYAYRSAVRLVRAAAGSIPAAQFGPVALQGVREKMVGRGWTRRYVNESVTLVIRAFEQAVAREVIRPEALVALRCLKPLRRGELGVPEGKKVKGVPIAHVEAVKPHLSRQAAAVVDVMLLTGARCDEVVRMRPCDIEAGGDVWLYRPDGHKNEHRGHERLVCIGPRAREVIQPFLQARSKLTDFLFSPAEAEAERRQAMHKKRRTPEHYGNRPGTNRKAQPKWKPGGRYTTGSIRRAIERACDAAGVSRWTPHQLRHTAATTIRKAAGVEAAAVILGHASATLTDAVYAERDMGKARDVALKVG